MKKIKDSIDTGRMKTSGNEIEFCLTIGEAQTLLKKSLQFMF